MKRMIVKSTLVGLFLFSLIVVPACSQSTAEPSALTGNDDIHERHVTGMESQAADF